MLYQTWHRGSQKLPRRLPWEQLSQTLRAALRKIWTSSISLRTTRRASLLPSRQLWMAALVSTRRRRGSNAGWPDGG